MTDTKKILNGLLDADAKEVLINGGIVIDPDSGESFNTHRADAKRHVPAAAAAGKVLVSRADGANEWADAATLGLDDAMHFKGTLGTGGTITAVPATGYKSGDTYKIVTAGTYAGHVCEAGDLIMAITEAAADATEVNDAHWTVSQTNIDGAVTGPAASTDAHVAVFDGASGKVVKDSGFTLGASVPADAVFHSGVALVGSAGETPVYNGRLRLVVAEYTPSAA